jgi:hypothetical protein
VVQILQRDTVERLDLYRIDALLDTRYARLAARYESNRGLSLGRTGTLLDLALVLRAVPGLEGLAIDYRTLDFDHGRVDLIDATTGDAIETTPLRVQLGTLDLSYPMHPNVTLFARRFTQDLPRNIYLQPDGGAPRQISEQLLAVDTTAYAIGLTLHHPDDGEGLFGALRGWIGLGAYDIATVAAGTPLDDGWLTASGLELTLGWRLPLGAGFSLGISDTLTLLRLDPNGLPEGIERQVLADGSDPNGWSLEFGTAEVLNGFEVDLTWTY